MLTFHLGPKRMSPKVLPAVKNPSFPWVGGFWKELHGLLWMAGWSCASSLYHTAATLHAQNQAISNHYAVRSISARHTSEVK